MMAPVGSSWQRQDAAKIPISTCKLPLLLGTDEPATLLASGNEVIEYSEMGRTIWPARGRVAKKKQLGSPV
jgi:hypothetical protein